jgi:hypothetical protein
MIAVLHFLRHTEQPADAIAAFRWQMTPGSMLAISHITSDGTPPSVRARIEHAYAAATAPAIFRTKQEIGTFFGDLQLVDPGLTDVGRWHSSHLRPRSTLRLIDGVAIR